MELQDIDLKDLIEREIGEHFNRQGYIKCPFHNEKTPSLAVKFYPDINKQRFKCFGCDASGDAIDFIMKLKNMKYNEAREYLGLTVEKSVQEQQIEKVKGYIEWQIKKFKWSENLIGLFSFVNDKGEIAYFKAKFKNDKGEKRLSYYHIENDKVINKRGSEELPYNLYNAIEGIKNGKTLIICEGEKDVNNLNSTLKYSNYVATSVKNVKDLSMYEGAYLYVCGDTGEAGGKYKWSIYKKLFKSSKSFKFINLPGIKSMGDNKDVTDWLNADHDKKDLLNAFERSLDLKSEFELQQNKGGIYKIAYKGKGDDAVKYKKYLTNFNLIEATRIRFEDEDQEGVKLVLKSPTGNIIEKIGSSTVFDDVRSFRNFLGTLDLSFKGRVEELVDLKDWINKYFALEVEEIHQGVKFTEKDGDIIFITNDGSVSNGKIFASIKSNAKDNVDILDTESISKEELKEIKKHIFKFATPDKTIPIIGTIINDLAVYQNQQIKKKLHHLMIVGESGSGKSTILENVIIPILNYPKNAKEAIGAASPFGMIKGLSVGNYPKIYDEFKPSRMDRYKILRISDILRNLYDRDTVSRGNKSLNVEYFHLNRPVIIAGEESYPNQEKALIERSCIVYLGKRERTEKHTAAMKWIIEHEDILNKFGRTLIDTILNLKVEEYVEIRKSITPLIKGLKDRPSNTAINICCGIEIFNILLEKYDINPITNYVDYVMTNIKTEVLENGVETYSSVENMLNLYNDLIEDGRAYEPQKVVKYRGDGLFIKTSEMINQINEYINRVGNIDVIPLGLRDFRKQAMKAGYLEGISNKVLKVDNDKTARFDTYNKKMLRKLKVNSIIPQEIEDVTELENNIIPFS